MILGTFGQQGLGKEESTPSMTLGQVDFQTFRKCRKRKKFKYDW